MKPIVKPAELEIVRLTEANLLGALLIDAGYSDALEAVKKIIGVDDFLPNYLYRRHQRIFQAMVEADHTDQISVANKMNERSELQQGDIAYMSKLIADFVDPLDCEHYARLVADNAARWRSGGRAKPRYSGVV